MISLVTLLALGSGALAADPPFAPGSGDDAPIILAILEAPPGDVPPVGITLDSQRFAFTPLAGGWSSRGAWSDGVMDEIARLRPDQGICVESFESFDRSVTETADGGAHAFVGEITARPEGQFAVRVLFIQRLPPVREGRPFLSIQDWEYVVEVDAGGRVSVVERSRIAIT